MGKTADRNLAVPSDGSKRSARTCGGHAALLPAAGAEEDPRGLQGSTTLQWERGTSENANCIQAQPGGFTNGGKAHIIRANAKKERSTCPARRQREGVTGCKPRPPGDGEMRSGAGGGKSPPGGSRYQPNEPKSEVGPRVIIAFANAVAFAGAFFYPGPV